MDTAKSLDLAGFVGIILFLYAVKALVLRYLRGDAVAFAGFTAAVAACVPLTWLGADWDNPNWYPISIYVGSPVALLTVPSLSFFIDLCRRAAGHEGGWLWRVPLEFLAMPAWVYVWVHVMMFVLGWGWI